MIPAQVVGHAVDTLEDVGYVARQDDGAEDGEAEDEGGGGGAEGGGFDMRPGVGGE